MQNQTDNLKLLTLLRAEQCSYPFKEGYQGLLRLLLSVCNNKNISK